MWIELLTQHVSLYIEKGGVTMNTTTENDVRLVTGLPRSLPVTFIRLEQIGHDRALHVLDVLKNGWTPIILGSIQGIRNEEMLESFLSYRGIALEGEKYKNLLTFLKKLAHEFTQ